jgi:hypothetical protein
MALEDAKNPMQGVSGPGTYAKRTDLQYSPDTYGAGVEMAAQKAGAPLAKTGGVKLSQAPTVSAGAAPTGVGLYEPTQRPNEPITHGINIGAGGGAEVLAMRQPDDSGFRMNIDSAKPVLAYIADLPATSPETRAAIKQLWDMQ